MSPDGSPPAVDDIRGLFIPWRAPDDPVRVHDALGRAWQVVRIDPRLWKLRRPLDDRTA